MGMFLTRHHLCWAFAHTLSNPTSQNDAVIEEELQQTQVLATELAAQGEIVE
jgi:hypothetical protein